MRVLRFLPCCLIPLSLVCHAQSRRTEITQFGAIGLAPGQQLRVTVRATATGNGCHVQLVYILPTGASAQRSLTLNLMAGTSASDTLNVPADGTELLVRPAAWVEKDSKSRDCEFTAQAGEKASATFREIARNDECGSGTCKGIAAEELQERTLRLYVSAKEGIPCRAELGFRLPNGSASASSKFVTLHPNHGESLDWRPELDDSMGAGETVVPVVAFHKDDGCAVSAEAVASKSGGLTRQIPVLAYDSPVVGLAMDPASLPATVTALLSEVSRNPDDLWTVIALARAYDKQGLRNRAAELLTKATKVAPNAPEIWYFLAEFNFQMHNYPASAEYLEKYLSLVPGDVRGLSAYGETLAKLNRFKEAQQILLPLLSAPLTRTPAALDSEAEVLLGEEHYDAALSNVEEAELRHPGCAANLHMKADILFALGRFDEAEHSAERLLQINPTDDTAHLLLAKLYTKKGKLDQAAVQTAWLRENVIKSQ